MKSDSVSIIMATFNSEKYISETINSILDQTYENWELIISDDNSTDSTVEILKEFSKKDKRLKLFTLNKNIGAGNARNNSLLKAQGKFVAFCDSDDLWLKNKLEKQISFLNSNDQNLTYSRYLEIDEKGKIIREIKSPRKINLKKILKNDYIGFSTLIYNSQKVGIPLMSSLRRRQDYLYKINLFKGCGNIIGIEEPLVKYRVRSDSISSNKFKLIKYNYQVYRELNFSRLKSTIYFIVFIYYLIIKKLRIKFSFNL